jgi:AcrR family transcriptional regulator
MGIRPGTETKLLDAADQLFSSRGIAATPIDAVTRQAGVSAATLYRGYASKEALVAAVLDRRHHIWLEVWDRAVAAQASDEGRLLAVFDALDDVRTRPIGSRWCAFLGAAAEFTDAPPEIERAVRQDTEAMRTRLLHFATAIDGRRDSEMAEQLLLIITGYLAMRLRAPDHTTATARSVAAVLIRARLAIS